MLHHKYVWFMNYSSWLCGYYSFIFIYCGRFMVMVMVVHLHSTARSTGTYLQNALQLPPQQGFSTQPWCEDSRKKPTYPCRVVLDLSAQVHLVYFYWCVVSFDCTFCDHHLPLLYHVFSTWLLMLSSYDTVSFVLLLYVCGLNVFCHVFCS